MKEQLIAQGRNRMQELILARNLVRAGVPPEEAYQMAQLLKKVNCSPDEEALSRRVWQRVRSQ
jgi:2-phosphoglycerate kinase